MQMEFFSLATQATEGELTEEKKLIIGAHMDQNELFAWEARQGMTRADAKSGLVTLMRRNQMLSEIESKLQAD